MSKKKITVKSILVSAAIAVATSIAIVVIVNTNSMNKSIDSALDAIEESYTLTPIDIDEDYRNLTMYGVMKFDTSQYEIEGLGNLSIMKTNIGVMQMATFVITPLEKNAPLISVDYMYMLGNRMAYIEYYNLLNEDIKEDDSYTNLMNGIRTNNTSNYTNITDKEVEPAWYDDMLDDATLHKKGTFIDDEALTKMLVENISYYSESVKVMEPLTEEEQEIKVELTEEYYNGLISNGGISTDVFKKELGEDVTRDFFNKVFFGTYQNNNTVYNN